MRFFAPAGGSYWTQIKSLFPSPSLAPQGRCAGSSGAVLGRHRPGNSWTLHYDFGGQRSTARGAYCQ